MIQKTPNHAPTVLGWQQMTTTMNLATGYQIELTYLGGGNARATAVDVNLGTHGIAITTNVNTAYVNSSDPVGALFVGSRATNCNAINTQHQVGIYDFQFQ